jgi:hypothetical protein
MWSSGGGTDFSTHSEHLQTLDGAVAHTENPIFPSRDSRVISSPIRIKKGIRKTDVFGMDVW